MRHESGRKIISSAPSRLAARVLALAAGLPVCAQAPPPRLEPLVLQTDLTLEQVGMPDRGESMGLAGFHFLFEGPRGFRFGPAFFGAVRGKRNGFIGSGFEAAWNHTLTERLAFEASFFAGGVGGGSAAVGGGLMLRPAVGLSYNRGSERWGVGVSKVRFPSGDIDSTQLAFTWGRRFEGLAFGGHPSAWSSPSLEGLLPEGTGVLFRQSTVEVTVQRYSQPGGLVGNDGRHNMGSSIDLLGFGWNRYVGPYAFFRLETAGAFRGSAGGYNEILAGGGGRLPLLEGGRVALLGTVVAGSGGGGGIGAGGGFLAKASVGLTADLGRTMSATLEAGQVRAPSTDFRATVVAFKLGWNLELAEPGQPEAAQAAPDGGGSFLKWRIRGAYQRFASSQRRPGGQASQPVGQSVLKVDWMGTDHLYLTGQAGFALSGQAGAWGTGFVGPGFQTSSFHGHRLFLELLAGAGGGAGIDSSGGALLQPLAGWLWEASPRWGLQLSAGRTKSLHGTFNTSTLDLGLVYRGAFLQR